MALTSISDRLTPSVPIEQTFGAQPVATGRKITTLFGHRAATGGNGADYGAYMVTNVGDSDAALAEVDALAGTGSQIGKMAEAFVKANAAVGRSNFPAFRVVLIPNGETSFGGASEALNAVKTLRSDMLVSCYPASDDSGSPGNRSKLLSFAAMISGPDRDRLQQFGSFAIFGALDILATAEAYNVNSRNGLVAYLQDTNTALVTENGDVANGSKTILNVADTSGIFEGAEITGTAIPANTVVVGPVIPGQITMSQAATGTHVAESIAYQNVISQSEEILAAAQAASIMQSAFPYMPLQDVEVGGLLKPRKNTDWIVADPQGASEAALQAGLSPMIILPNGGVGLLRTRTTYTTTPQNVPVTAYFDWQDLVLLNDFREDCYLICQNPPFNGNPGGTKASATVAALLKDEILRMAQEYEDEGAFQGVKTLAPSFQVAPSKTSRGRFDFKIPVNVIPGLYVIAGNIQAVAGLGDFTV